MIASAYAPNTLPLSRPGTQRRLYGMELFQFAASSVNPEQQPAESNAGRGGKHQRVKFESATGPRKRRVRRRVSSCQFLGGARTAGLHGRWSSLDRGLRADFSQPYVFQPHFSLNGEGQRWYTDTPAYQSVVSGGKLSLKHRANAKTSWSISMTSERDSSAIAPDVLNDLTLRNDLIALGLDPRTGQQSGTINAAGFEIQHSTVDNLLDAHRGYQLSFKVEQAGGPFGGSFTYTALSADARHYLSLGDRIVVASRVQSGNIAPADNSETGVPFSKKYFLGGATSIRGWGRFEVSPLSDGIPIGGNSMLAASVGLRARRRQTRQRRDVIVAVRACRRNRLTTCVMVGTGLRYQTPVGPVRFDLPSTPINPTLVNGVPQTRRWRVHISIGQAF